MSEASSPAPTTTRIKTYLRLRPSSRPSSDRASIRALDDATSLEDEDSEDETLSSSKRRRIVECKAALDRRMGAAQTVAQKFAFDGVFDESATQGAVFDEVGSDVVRAALDGYNATLFAYGQTGSGKTYTLTGGAAEYEDRGIVPRALSMIFNEIESISAQNDVKFTVEVNYVEIYLEQAYDLLATNLDERQSAARGYARASEIPLPKVRFMEDENGQMHTMDLTTRVVSSEGEALDLLFVGDTNRAVAETPLNMASSRSHCVFTVIITRRSRDTDTLRRAKLHLVDLAGSERVNKSRVDGTTLQEAKYINVSLHFLEQVIVALQERAEGNVNIHVPYRNSLMTLMLRDSLGGNCRTVMIATASAEMHAFAESVSTCRFAQRVRKISNELFVNEELDVDLLIARLKEENKRLRVELALLRRETSSNDEDFEMELSTDALSKLVENVRRYIDDDDFKLECGSSVAKIRAVQRILRDMCRAAEAKSGIAIDAVADQNPSPRAVSSPASTSSDRNTESDDADSDASSAESKFMAFCKSVSRVAPELEKNSQQMTSYAATARELAREMNQLKHDVNVDRGALDALRIARIVDVSAKPSSEEISLERRVESTLRRHGRARADLEELRHRIQERRARIDILKTSLADEYRAHRARENHS